MVRKADLLFLKLAVKNRVLTEDKAREILEKLERSPQGTKARYLCVERGLIDEKTAKQLKKIVRQYLEEKAEKATKGRRIGNYAVEDKIGAGAMGIVYKARHVKLGRPVALKLLLPEFAQDEKYIERFEREARAAAQLNHPNIVQCFDAGSDDDVVYIAMEFIDGETVKDRVERDGPLPEKLAVEITAKVARALEHASAAGLMHRDVKPANIMIAAEGGVKLLDLGLAKKIEREEDSNLTEPGRAIGTPFYMAPEQALEGTIDHRADLYSLGATLFFMLAGEPPYKAPTPTGVLAKHVNDPIPSVRARRPECSAGVEKVIVRMLAKKPEDRYQKHATLVADLEDLASGLMPEVKREAPAARDHAGGALPPRSAPGRSGTRTRTERTGSGATRSGSRVPAAKSGASFALAAGIVGAGLVGAFFIVRPTSAAPSETTKSGARPASQAAPFAPDKSLPTSSNGELAGSALETAARRQLETALRSGKKDWDLQNLLEAIGRTHAGTQAGDEARQQAAQLAARLDGEEQAELARLAEPLEARAKNGELLAAADGYAALADRFHGENATKAARERGASLEKRAENIVLAADERARRHVEEGHEDLAAKTLRGSLDLRRGAARQAAADQAAELERTFSSKKDHEKEEKLASESSRVRTLAAGLREAVRSRHVPAAVDAARTELAKLTFPEPRAKAQLYLDHMEELAQLETLASRSFVVLKGQTVHVERRGGQPVEGTLKAVTDRNIAIEPRTNVVIRVSFDEIDELAIATWIRRAKTLDEAKLSHLIAVLKCWRGDEDAVMAAGKDSKLADLARELGPSEPAVAKHVDEPREAPAGDVKPISSPSEPVAEPRIANERERLLYENKEKIFPDATESTWGPGFGPEGAPAAVYDFTIGNRDFSGLWRVESGSAIPTPNGQVSRQGLSLRSSDGRAVFEVPFTGGVKFRVDFVSYGTLAQESRFSAVIEDSRKKERFESRFGVLKNEGRHKPKSVPEPEGLLDRISTNKQHSLEVTINKGVISSRLDGVAMGDLEAKDLGDLKLAIEWEKVTIHVLGVIVQGTPNETYLKKALETKKK